MRPATVLRLAVTGSRVDALRLVLTACGAVLAALALLAALTVVGIGAEDGPYTSDLLNQAGLHPGVVIALVGLCLPVLVLLAQCSRIGSPARDRRLAAIRLAGASPAQVARMVTVEAGVGALAGSLAGTGLFFLLRVLLDERVPGAGPSASAVYGTDGPLVNPLGALRLPTDVLLPAWQYVVIVGAVPALVVAATAWAVRRVAFTPFGVVHPVRTRPPRVVPLVLLVVGVAVFFVLAAVLTAGVAVPSAVLLLSVLGGFLCTTAGLLAGQGAITQAVGRFLVRRTSRPALLLATRRMIADPFAATRATAVLTVAVLVAAGAQRLRQMTLAGQVPGDTDPFYAHTYDLVDLVLVVAAVLAALGLLVAAAEGIVARRRTYAAVVAAGTPRGVVARAILAEFLLPLVPSLLLATIAGTLAAVGFFGTTARTYVTTATSDGSSTASVGEHTVGLDWPPLLAVLALGLAVAAVTTLLGLVFLRSATDVGELRAAA